MRHAAAFCLLALATLPLPLRAQQAEANPNNTDPSELYLKAFTAAQQAEKLDGDGKARAALAKYRFAASLLEQVGQTNPNWQPLIVSYRLRKTTDSIKLLEQKVATLPPPPPSERVPIPTEEDPLPQPDDAAPGSGGAGAPLQGAETVDRSAMELQARLAKVQKDLKQALDERNAAEKEKADAIRAKKDIELQLETAKTDVKIMEKRFERAKMDKDDAQAEIDKTEAKLKEASAAAPDAGTATPTTRKGQRGQIGKLKQELAKAQADLAAAAKEKDSLAAKLADSGKQTAALTVERDKAVALNNLGPDEAQRIQTLQNENAALTQKLGAAESSLAKLNEESVQKKGEIEGMQKELATLKDQLAASRDASDRSATTITGLRSQLDDSAHRLEELKAKGETSEDFSRLSKENEMLRGIVMRQLKDQARRVAAKKMVNDELARLEVQSKTLAEQVEVLGQPTLQLTDEERGLFKETQVSISDNANPETMALSLAAVKPKGPGTPAAGREAPVDSHAPPVPGASPAAAPAGKPQPQRGPLAAAGKAPAGSPPASTAGMPSVAMGAPASGTPSGIPAGAPADSEAPKVETTLKPKVADELVPLATDAVNEFDRGLYADAEKSYDKLLAREPQNPYLLSNQGVVLFKQDKLKSAEVMLKKAITASPKDAFSQTTLGIVYYKMHRYNDAIEALTRAITLDPKNATAHNYLGITSSQKGWPEAGIEELQKAISLNPNYADAHFNIAVIYATNQPPAKDRAQEHYHIATALGATPDPMLERLLQN